MIQEFTHSRTRRPIIIYSTTSSRHVVESFAEVIGALRKKDIDVRFVGWPTDEWYAGNAAAAYLHNGFLVDSEVLSRSSRSHEPWWRTPGIVDEFFREWPNMRKKVLGRLELNRPDLMLIADDTGLLEVALIKTFMRSSIPVLLIEHGMGFALRMPPPTEIEKILRPTLRRSLSMAKACASSIWKRSPSAILLQCLKPMGYNGNYSICTHGQLSHSILQQHASLRCRLHATGYPYYDRFVRTARTRSVRNVATGSRPRLLIVSNGSIIFGDGRSSMDFYRRVLELILSVRSHFDVSVRLKPGELPGMLPAPVLAELENVGVAFDDNTRSTLETLGRYDIIVGDETMVTHEALILGLPVVLLGYQSSDACPASPTMRSMLEQHVMMPVIGEPTQATSVLRRALTTETRATMVQEYWKNEEIFHHHLDGGSGERVAEIALQQIKGH